MSSHPEKMQEIENVLIDHLGGVPSIVITEYSWAELSRFDYSVDVTDDQKMRMYSLVYGVYMMMFPMFYGFFTEMTTNDAEDSMVFSDFWKEKNLKDAALAGFGFWRLDILSMLKHGDSYEFNQELTEVTASTSTAPRSLTLNPQSFNLSACPAASKILTAAL